MTYEACVEALLASPRFGRKNGLENMDKLIEALALDMDRFKIIHVAGTNGKGSVCAMLAAMFKAEGIRAGLFTSPHLIRINERFKMDLEDVRDEAFAAACTKVAEAVGKLEAADEASPTFFEWMLAIALVLFSEAGIEWIILETGLGGRFDATNAMKGKELAVITRIGLDHTEHLGETLTAIAGEKAGILRAGRPAVYWSREPEAAGVIEERCRELGAFPIPVSGDRCAVARKNAEGIDFYYNNKYYNGIYFKIDNPAPYMLDNASIALEAAAVLAPVLSPDSARRGLADFRWPGRMERAGEHILLDGAHNPDGIQALCGTLETMGGRQEIQLLFACMKDKQYEAMIRQLAACSAISRVWTTEAYGGRSVAAQELAELFQECGKEASPAPQDLGKFLEGFRDPGSSRILCCAGSLYLVGEIKKIIGGWQDDQFRRGTQEVQD